MKNNCKHDWRFIYKTWNNGFDLFHCTKCLKIIKFREAIKLNVKTSHKVDCANSGEGK